MRDGGAAVEVSFDIQTYCLRTGERCLSYWMNPDDAKILVFDQNQWVLDEHVDGLQVHEWRSGPPRN